MPPPPDTLPPDTLPKPKIIGSFDPVRIRRVCWMGHMVVIEKTHRNQHLDRWLAYPLGGERSKARRFAHYGEAEVWALDWLWRAAGRPDFPRLPFDR